MTDNPPTTPLLHGAVVRHHGKPPNLRCLGDTTTLVLADINEIGMPKPLSLPTAELNQVFPNE
jgi:hypothetical protein